MTNRDQLRIRLFGTFEVHRGGTPFGPRDWHSQQARTILKVLLARRGRAVTSDQLLEILWPDEDPNATRSRLYVRISQLRKALDPGDPSAFVVTVAGGYTFAPESDCWIDAVEFEALAQQGRLKQEERDLAGAITAYEEACTLYRGDLLEEDVYGDWAFVERERLRERFLTLLMELAECYAQQGRYRRAIVHCHRLLTWDPFREAAYVRLMLYHYHAGERGEAVRVYARCQEVLGDELGVEPLPTTQALAGRIQDGTLWMVEAGPRYPPPAYQGRLFEVPYSVGNPPFVGREREYAWLVEKARDEAVRVVLIGGEAGAGKSRLVDEFAGYAISQEMPILRARLSLAEAAPFAAVTQALRPLVSRAALAGLAPEARAALALLFPVVRDLFPEMPSAGGREGAGDEARLFRAVRSFVRKALPDGAIVVVDDAQRMDEASCRLLAHLADTLTLVLAYRQEEVTADHPLHVEFRALRRAGHVAEMALERLSRAASHDLLRSLARSIPAQVAEHVAERAGGSPLFLIALLQNLFEEGVLHVDAAGRWAATESESLPLPASMRETVEMRLGRLNRAQRRVFDLISVLGGEFGFALLHAATGEAEDGLLDALDSLMDAGLVVEPRTTGREEFAAAHDVYVEVAYGNLPGVRRRRLHRSVGEGLLRLRGEEPAVSGQLAFHFARAGEPAQAARFAELAGEHALLLYSGARAIRHLEDAKRWREEAELPADKGERARLNFHLGEALRLAGRYEEALSYLVEALPDSEGEIKLAAAFHIVTLGAMMGASLARFAELAPTLEREFTAMGQTWPLAGFRWMQGYMLTIQGHRAPARQCTAEGWRLARGLLARGDPAPPGLRSWGYLVLARAHERWGDWRLALRYAARSLARYTAEEDQYGIAASHVTRAAVLYGLGEWSEALDACGRCIELAAEAEDPRWMGEALYFAGSVHLEQGNHAQAEENGRQVLEAARATGDLLRGGLAQILLARLAIDQNRPEGAIPLLEAQVRAARVAGAESYGVLALRYLAEAHLQACDHDAAVTKAREGLTLSERSGMKRERCGCLQVLGMASAQSGAFAAGERILLDAVQLAERTGCRYELATARRRLGDVYRMEGARDQAWAWLAAAHTVYDELGAWRDAAAVRHALDTLALD